MGSEQVLALIQQAIDADPGGGLTVAQVLEERAAPPGVRTPASDQAAVDMLNSRVGARRWNIHDLVDTQYPSMICLSEQIAVNHALRREANEREALADLQASYDAAVKDLREIDRIAVKCEWERSLNSAPNRQVSVIAAKYRVETDPLVEAVETVLAGFENRNHAVQYAAQIRAELAKRGVTV